MTTPSQPRVSWLSRPLPGLPGWTRETAAWAALTLVVLVTRLLSLGVRAMSHDESIHASLSFNLFESGTYLHDPSYHGPLLYHVNALLYLLFGVTDVTARLGPAIAGIALLFTVRLFRRPLGSTAALGIALLVTISPSLTFYSRYIRNDIYIALLSLLATCFVFRYLEDRRPQRLVSVTVVLALAFATKENSFIFGVTLGSFLCLLALVRWRQGERIRSGNAAADVAALLLTLALPFAGATGYLLLGWPFESYSTPERLPGNLVLVLVFLAASVLLAWLWFGRRPVGSGIGFVSWLRLAAVFWTINLLLFTSFFADFPRGIVSGTLGGLAYWLTQHPVARGGQPVYYYAIIGALYELLPVLLSVFGTVAVLRRARTTPLLAWLVWWTWSSWALYSVAGERMPWLLVHIALPSCLLGGWWLAVVLQRIPWRPVVDHRALWLLGSLPLLLVVLVRLGQSTPFAGRDVQSVSSTMGWLLHLLIAAVIVVVSLRRMALLELGVGRRLLGVGLLAALVLLTLRASLMLSFSNQDLATEPIVYAHGTPDIKRAMREIELIAQRTVGRERIQIAVDDESTWPFVWYLRDYPGTVFYGKTPTLRAMKSTVVLVGPSNYDAVRPYLVNDYDRRTYRLSWWPQEGYRGLTWQRLVELVRDPQRRRVLWQIVLHRRYPGTSLSEWPKLKEFEMYVRRDLGSVIWDLGVLPLSADSARAEVLPLSVVASHSATYGGMPLRVPRDVALGPAGERVIADTGNHRIVILDDDGRFELAFGRRCSLRSGEGCRDPDGDGPLQPGDGQFDEPWGVALDDEGTIFVADTWNGRVQTFDLDGRFLAGWPNDVSDATPLFGPRDLVVDRDGNLLVADTGNKRLLQFRKDGSLLRAVGRGGVGPAEFDEPVGLALDPLDGSIYVADAWNGRIQKLTPQLEFESEWNVRAWRSNAPGDKPYVAAWHGRIYATDPENSRVLVHDGTGSLLQILIGGTPGSDERLARPSGLVVDPARGRLVVADAGNDRVVELALTGPEP